jgi:hypothetical protein
VLQAVKKIPKVCSKPSIAPLDFYFFEPVFFAINLYAKVSQNYPDIACQTGQSVKLPAGGRQVLILPQITLA